MISAEMAILQAALRVDDPNGDHLRSTIQSPDASDSPTFKPWNQQPQIDWSKLIYLGNHHQVLPLLFRRLEKHAADQIPPEPLGELKSLYWSIALRNQRLSETLFEVLDLLDRNAGAAQPIRALPFKGLMLAIQAYGEITLRQFLDIDILVPESDALRALQILTEAGFLPETPLDPKTRPWMLRSAYHLRLQRQADILELHWTIAERSNVHPLRSDRLWKELGLVTLSGRQVAGLSFENTLLAACLHGAGNQWQQLKWIADIAHLMDKAADFDWLGYLEDMRRAGFRRIVCLGLSLAGEICGAELPEQVKKYIQCDPIVARLSEQVKAQALSDIRNLGSISNNQFYWRTRERLPDRLYYFFDQAFLPKQVEWESLPLPVGFYPLYYLLRPARLAWKFNPLRKS